MGWAHKGAGMPISAGRSVRTPHAQLPSVNGMAHADACCHRCRVARGAWIQQGARVMPGVTVGKGTRLLPAATVLPGEELAGGTLWGGSPASPQGRAVQPHLSRRFTTAGPAGSAGGAGQRLRRGRLDTSGLDLSAYPDPSGGGESEA